MTTAEREAEGLFYWRTLVNEKGAGVGFGNAIPGGWWAALAVFPNICFYLSLKRDAIKIRFFWFAFRFTRNREDVHLHPGP